MKISKIKLNCMICGKEIKLNFKSITAICKKRQITREKTLIYDPFFLSE